MSEKTPVNHEKDAGTQSVFAVIDLRVDPAVVALVRMAEEAGFLEELPSDRRDKLVAYLTLPVTYKELAPAFGMASTGLRDNVQATLDEFAGKIFRNRGNFRDGQPVRRQVVRRYSLVRQVKSSRQPRPMGQ